MFLDEARLAARIHHPNVVATFDVGEDEEGIFLIMEYVEGPALNTLAGAFQKRERRPLPRPVTLRIFLDMLAGLHAAHELRGAEGEPLHVVHRDVSPHNILVGVDGTARLMDFGVAQARGRLSSTEAGQLKGKIAFMAPEQMDGGPIDRCADVYAAGVTLWQALTGTRLLSADQDGALLVQALRAERRSPREVDPTIPAALEAACMRALRPAPADRFATAAALAHALSTSGVPIASAGEVGALVRDLNVHARPVHDGGLPRLPAPPSLALDQAPVAPRTDSGEGAPETPASPGTRAGRWVMVAGGALGVVLAALVLTLGRGSRGSATPTASAPSMPPAAPTPDRAASTAITDAATPPATTMATVAVPPEPRPGRARPSSPFKPAAASPPSASMKAPPPSSTTFVPREL
jgi:serine/threonine-protein kinase